MNRDGFWYTSRAAIGASLCALAACSDGVSAAANNEQRTQEDLTFVQLGQNAPALVATTTSFWARVGVNKEIRLYYKPRPGRNDSTEYLRFRVRQKSLSKRPDGSSFASSDSILITLRVTDPSKLIVDFSPSGLQFDPKEPAELKLSLKEKGGDLNDDGSVDAADTTLLPRLSIWRQEAAGLPWFKLVSSLTVTNDELEAKLTGFTSYAVAY